MRLQNLGSSGNKKRPASGEKKPGRKRNSSKKDNDDEDEESEMPRSPNLHDDDTVSSEGSSTVLEPEEIFQPEDVLEHNKETEREEPEDLKVTPTTTTKRSQEGTSKHETKGKKPRTSNKPKDKKQKLTPTIDTVEEIVAVTDHRALKKNKPQFQVEWDNGFVMWGEPKDLIDDGAGNLICAYVKKKSLHIVNPWKGIWKKCGGK